MSIDPIFPLIARSIMGDIPLPTGLECFAGAEFRRQELRNQLCDFIAKCLANSTESVNINVPSLGEITRAQLILFLNYTTPPIEDQEVLKSVKVESEIAAENIAAKIQLNRFSGMEICEQN